MLKHAPTGASKWRGIALAAALCVPAMTIAFATEPPQAKERSPRPERRVVVPSDLHVQPDQLYNRFYSVDDLPVWSVEGGEPGRTDLSREKVFDPSLLVSYIKMGVGRDASGSSLDVNVYRGNLGLMITTTSRNHETIAEVLRKLRGQGGGE